MMAAGALLLSTAAYLALRSTPVSSTDSVAVKQNQVVVLLGDVGGTNIRFTLRRLDLTTRLSVEVKPFQKFPSQE